MKEEVNNLDRDDICVHCGKNIGTYRINPYTEDVEGVEEWEYICDTCYEDLKDDI